MYFEHVKSYGDDSGVTDFEAVIREIAADYNIPEEELDFESSFWDGVLSVCEEAVCSKGIEYHCDWHHDEDRECLTFNVQRILVSSEEELQEYCSIVRKSFVS